jgi:meso-butanediol dehydrogenase/(S,S)-butanediol dehydrogenase/diacetyl reductase
MAGMGGDAGRGLAGKRVVVTGGSSGIGEATARRFIGEGAQVVVVALPDDALDTLEARLPGLSATIAADVADRAEVEAAFRVVDERLGGLDVLVANAGISRRHRFAEILAADWRRVLAVNLDGVFHCAQEAARRMIAPAAPGEPSGGVILVTASTNGLVGHPLYADYNASKAGVLALVRTMALELAPHIRVNAVCPGYVLTPMQRAEYTPEMLAAVNSRLPLGRHADPEEVAALFAFLASDEAAYITGAAIPLDGGETAGGLASRP